MRIDLHTHTFFSDGELLPSELLRRASVKGYAAIGVTDHADASNLEEVLGRLQRFATLQQGDFDLQLLIGVELTHLPPGRVAVLAREAKRLGADLVVVHGETIAEPVAKGTNRAAVECEFVDVLGHPGFITLDEARIAAANGVNLELSSRRGHSLTNGHVAQVAREAGAKMVVNTDAHHPDDLIDEASALDIALGAGLTVMEAEAAAIRNPKALLDRILKRRSTVRA